MVATVKRYECDACRKVDCISEDENIKAWMLGTEVGDLCPSCARAWENYKQSFKEKMRIDNGADLKYTTDKNSAILKVLYKESNLYDNE